MKKKILIITGGRSYFKIEEMHIYISKILSKLNSDNTEVIFGEAEGADRTALNICNWYHIKHKVFEADWDKYGKSAGLIRNQQMLEYALDADEATCLGFWNGRSRGTKNMLDIANESGIKTYVVMYNDKENNNE